MVRSITILNIRSCSHHSNNYILCDNCFNKISESIDITGVESPPWRDTMDSRYPYPDQKHRVYHIGIYIRITPDYNEQFCSACGKHRGFPDTPTTLLRNRIEEDLAKQIEYYRVYRKLMEFIPKEEIDSMLNSVRTYKPLTPSQNAAWQAWSDAHPLD